MGHPWSLPMSITPGPASSAKTSIETPELRRVQPWVLTAPLSVGPLSDAMHLWAPVL